MGGFLFGPQRLGLIGNQQTRDFIERGAAVDPQGLSSALQDHRHAVVDVGDIGCRRAGDDGEALAVGQPGKGEDVPAFRSDAVLAEGGTVLAPLEIGRYRNQASVLQ